MGRSIRPSKSPHGHTKDHMAGKYHPWKALQIEVQKIRQEDYHLPRPMTNHHPEHSKCHKCNKMIKKDEPVVRTPGGHGKRRTYHKTCLTDGKGVPMYE